MLQDVESYLGRCFAMKNLGEAAYILGIQIYRDRSEQLIGLCQNAYIDKIFKRFYMENSKRGSILMKEKLKLSKSQGASTLADVKGMKNIPYASAVRPIMYAEVVWIRKLISGLGVVSTNKEPITMYCDNTKVITIANESRITEGARHYYAKVHYHREVIELSDAKLEKVHTYDNLADPFTKVLPLAKHSEHTQNIGMLPAIGLPPDDKTIRSKWLFKKKTDMDGVVHTYKARLVAKGFTQTYRVDYEETFSPIADVRAIRILVSIVAFYDYEIWKMDVKTAFINGHLSEEVYMVQHEGFANPKYPNRVCKLKHSIYGLKQVSRQWNKRFNDEIKKFRFTQNPNVPCIYKKASGSNGLKQVSRQWNKRFNDEIKKFRFTQNPNVPCIYKKASGSNGTFLILYVNDILIMGNHIPMLQDVESYLGRCFAMKNLGEAAYILGIQIYRDRSKQLIGLCQSSYIDKIFKRFYMENSKRGSILMKEKLKLSKSQGASTLADVKGMKNIPYASAVRPIMYAVRCTRPDVAFA
nr:retrotransposon protein, putative, Ty1-copia subclass [Tanacetum cinerariifolium]